MTIRFESDGYFIAVSSDDKVICRVATDATDIGMTESLSDFVCRHGGIDATLEYMRSCQA